MEDVNINRLDLQTLGSQLVIMPKIIPDHCSRPFDLMNRNGKRMKPEATRLTEAH